MKLHQVLVLGLENSQFSEKVLEKGLGSSKGTSAGKTEAGEEGGVKGLELLVKVLEVPCDGSTVGLYVGGQTLLTEGQTLLY